MLLLLLLLAPAVFGQQCQTGQDLGPCGDGGTCQSGSLCLTSQGVCCPFTYIFTTTLPPTTTLLPTTTRTSCVDKINPQTGVSDCPNIKYLCNDALYKDVMKDQCPYTCGFCSGNSTPTNTTCQDKINPNTGVSDCPNVKYLCNDPAYKALMKEQCPKTCGYC